MRNDESSTIIRWDKPVLYASILIGALLRFFRLGHQSIWGDEALTLQVYTGGQDFAQVLSNIWQRAFHPPLYYLIAHYWYELGTSELMLRFPSAVFGVAAIPVIYLLTRRLFGSGTAAISALIVALSPFHVWYSQEARMYSLQALLILGSMFFFLRSWQTRRPMDIALYGLTTVLGLFTHMATLSLVAAQGVFVLGAAVKDWRKNAFWIGAQALILLAFVPWMLHFLALHGGSWIGFEREASLLHLGYGLYTFNVGYSLGPSVSALHYLSARGAIQSYLPAIVLSTLVFGTLAALGLVSAYRANRFGFWFILCHFSVPLVLITAVSFLPGLSLNPRYLVVAIVPCWIILSLGVQVCARVRPALVIPAAAAVLIALSLHNHYFEPAYAKQDMRAAVALVNENARPGDVIVISSIELGGPFIYYFKRHDVPYFGYPPNAGLVDPDELPRDIAEMLSHKSRAWLILGRTWSSDPDELIPAHFNRFYHPVERAQFPGVTVGCYQLH